MSSTALYDPDGQLSIGQRAPDWTLPDTISGKSISLKSLNEKSKVICIIFSCNHCPYVIKYEERMIDLGKKYSDLGVSFAVISSNDVVKYPQDGPEAMMKRAAMKGFPFPYLYDESQDTARAYGAQVTPHVFLFDGDVKLRYRGAIDDNPDGEPRATRNLLREAVEAILNGEPVAAPVTTRAVGCSIKWK